MIIQERFNIILGSGSPRRSEILHNAGFSFEVVVRDVDEVWPCDLPLVNVAEYLATLKSEAYRDLLISEKELVITADSIVLIDHEVLGKPKDSTQAAEFLQMLSGREHQVITGVCLRSKTKSVSFSEVANVQFYDITDDEIEYYVQHFKPLDKAGAYAIQEWIGINKIQYIHGTFSNIMGLPMSRVYLELQRF